MSSVPRAGLVGAGSVVGGESFQSPGRFSRPGHENMTGANYIASTINAK